MTVEDLLRLLLDKRPYIPVCKLPQDVCAAVGLATTTVRLSRASLTHIIGDHSDVDVSQLMMMPKAIQWGLLVDDQDRPGTIIASYQDPYAARRYIAILKITRNRQEIWVSTFHRSKERQTRRILEKGPVLKKHDPQ
jgi:hypothetical protein